MAFRAGVRCSSVNLSDDLDKRYWRSMVKAIGEKRSLSSSTTPRFAPAAVHAMETPPMTGSSKKADFVPIYMLGGLIVFAATMGTLTAKQQLVHSPGVKVNKKKRESAPEVDDPDMIVGSADKFINKSLLRAVGQIQDPGKRVLKETQRPDPYTRSRDVETLKSVGVRN